MPEIQTEAQKPDLKKIRAAIKCRKRETYTPVVPNKQFGFVHHNVDCIGCRACACVSLKYDAA